MTILRSALTLPKFNSFIQLAEPRRSISLIRHFHASFKVESTYSNANSLIGRSRILKGRGLALSSTHLLLKNHLDFEKNIQPITSDKDLHALGGNAHILDRMADLVRYLQDPAGYVKNGLNPPKGVLLSGPPGVGKTLLAEAVAGHAGVPLILFSASEVNGPYVGQSEDVLRQFFKKAREIAPCVLCIDEIDAIGARRSGLDERQHVRSLTDQLLSLLSQDNSGVVVLATTNLPEILDPALVRPGRFDRHIVVSLPDLADREQILKIHTQNKKLDQNVTLKDLAAISAGFSGAKLAAWVNEAALAALREKSLTITTRHFDEGRCITTSGIAHTPIRSPSQQLFIAAHEAGHALVGRLLNQTLYKVSIRASSLGQGHTEFVPNEQSLVTKQQLLDEICICLAGRAAEKTLGEVHAGSQTDLDAAKEIARTMVMKEGMGSSICGSLREVEDILQIEMKRAEKLVNDHRSNWVSIYHALMNQEELFAKEFEEAWNGKCVSSSVHTISKKYAPLSLPPKSAPKEKQQTVQGQNNRSLFLTPIKVALALGIGSMDVVGVVKSGSGGFIIYFKEMTDEEMEQIGESLRTKLAGVDFIIMHKYRVITIRSTSAEAFAELVKKQNEGSFSK